MKRVIMIVVVAFCITSVCNAQKINAQDFLSKIEDAKKATQDPKKAVKAASWIALGTAYMDAATANVATIYANMPLKEMLLFMGKPETGDEIPLEKLNGVEYKVFKYPNVTIYLNAEDKIALIQETKPVLDGAFELAFENYKKALEVDPKSESKVKELMESLYTSAVIMGENQYNLGNYAKAQKYFVVSGLIGQHPSVNNASANRVLYFGAVAAVQAENYKEALVYMNDLMVKGYNADGEIYHYLGIANEKLGNNKEAEAAYVKGLETNQANQAVLQSLIAFYIATNDDPNKVIPYITKAQTTSPDNLSLYIAEGIAYDNLKQFDKSIIAYQKALDKSPGFFDALFNQALSYYKAAAEASSELNQLDISNQTAYKAKADEINGYLKKALAPLEEAHKVNPTETNAIDLLKTIYFRFRDESDTMKAKYEEYNEKYNSLQ